MPFQGSNLTQYKRTFNKALSKAHVKVECFKNVKLYFITMDLKRELCLGNKPISCLYLATMKLENMRNFVYPN